MISYETKISSIVSGEPEATGTEAQWITAIYLTLTDEQQSRVRQRLRGEVSSAARDGTQEKK